MPHPGSAWRTEIEAHVVQGRDRIELAAQCPELSEWRAMLMEEPELKECLRTWEAYIQEHNLAVPIEQATEEGVLASAADMGRRLDGCPGEWLISFAEFLQCPPEAVREFLAYTCYCLVQIERQRRTGRPEWCTEAASGSPEVLQDLMFKWGPRFRRHRWTW
jgi:hypothetical protein